MYEEIVHIKPEEVEADEEEIEAHYRKFTRTINSERIPDLSTGQKAFLDKLFGKE